MKVSKAIAGDLRKFADFLEQETTLTNFSHTYINGSISGYINGDSATINIYTYKPAEPVTPVPTPEEINPRDYDSSVGP